jgi:hypothetical protein
MLLAVDSIEARSSTDHTMRHAAALSRRGELPVNLRGTGRTRLCNEIQRKKKRKILFTKFENLICNLR